MNQEKKSNRLAGVVEAGQGRGAEAGARTANLNVALAVQAGVVPGLYRCRVTVLGQEHQGLLYYGINSLSHEDCLEVHLLNFSGELHGQMIEVFIGDFMRPPVQFATVDELKEQIKKDLADAGK